MLTLTHTIVGGAIGSFFIDVPAGQAVAFGLGVASHYALDKVPHWENWFGREIYGFPAGTPFKNLPKITVASGIFDVVVTIIAAYFIFQSQVTANWWASSVFWGALGGFSPDLLDNVPFLNGLTIKIPGVEKERRFHERVHISDEARRKVPYWTGLFTQLALIILGLWVLL